MNIHESGDLWDAFLRDIVEHPDDLTPRLILADWLEEQAHPIQRARGEFIRLMCEGTGESMRAAHRMLPHCFPQWWLPGWRSLERWHFHAGRNGTYHVEQPYRDRLTVLLLNGPLDVSATFCRGFVEELLLPLSVLEQYAGRLFTTCPLRKVDLTDRHPMATDQLGWCWHDQDAHLVEAGWPDEQETAALPSPIFTRLPSPRGLPEGHHWPSIGHIAHGYVSADEARDACSRAILAWGRELQGMPATEEKDHA